MLLYRIGPEGFYAAREPGGEARVLYSDPFETLPGGWELGRAVDLTWPLAEMVAYASRCMTLEPGDVVLAGTPAGVGPLAPGDVVEVEIPGVGVLVNPVEGWRG